ncbi:MAG: CHAT domain-containing protein, partial [Candidatus Rokuibacteriota bacterium]
MIEIPARLNIGPPSRGWAAWGIKALKVVGIDIPKAIAAFAADHVEGVLKPGPGLYRCSDTDAASLTAPGSLAGQGPSLVLLHGTASSTSGSFGELWKGGPSAPIHRLFSAYGGRILALQHETLTKSPIENALVAARRLLEVLGRDAEIHLVSHSRGGLVGELLARGMREGGAPFTRDDLALFEGAGRARDLDALTTLNTTLQDARFRVSRFVRVACPARGTTLADGRLDRYFSVLVNAVGLVPGLKANPVYDGLTSLLAGVLKQRTKPEELPGLEAQMPGSPLVLMLNQPGVTTAADLHVLGGDLEGTGIVGRLKTFATDLYYREDHDLVVNTPAMFGGTERRDGIRYWIDTGGDVTHFNYFARSDTATRLVAALIGERADFHGLKVPPSIVTVDDYRKRALVAQPIVFVLPGIMGSELTVGGEAVWMKMFALAMGGLSALRTGADVKPTGLIHSGYGDLCRFLSATHEVVPFPYDWRLSIEESAETLRTAIDARLPEAEAQEQPVRIVAHSMGGLVVRAMLATEQGQRTWARMCKHPGARFIMLGTPNSGSHSIPAMLIGRDALVKKLALVDVKHDYAGLLETIAGFQGVLELLPYGSSPDLLDPATWQVLFDNDVPSSRGLFSSSVETAKSAGFAWTRPAATALARARAVRDKIVNGPVDPGRMLYVAGVADETACDIVVDPIAAAGRRVRVLASAHGDGRVLWKTGIPAGLRTFYMDAVHGDLASTEDAFPALLDLLTTGTTSKLPGAAPVRRTAANEVVEMREPIPEMVPDREELVASALGGRRRRVRGPSAARRRVQVRVVHDDLSNANWPVLVGHYENDVIVGAEAYLDRQLAGRLSELRHMDLYPGGIGTAVIALNHQDGGKAEHPGAIVAGLGPVGDLKSGRLTMALSHALTTYGAERVGLERRRRQREREDDHAPVAYPVGVTALLVGSSDGGVSLSDSLHALLRAVAAANDRLEMKSRQDEKPTLTAWISQVDIIELYADLAIGAVHALRDLARSTEVSAGFVIDETLTAGDGGRRRARFDAAPGWWQRVRVTRSGDGLQLEALTQIARAPATILPTQRQAVDTFLERVTATTAFDPSLGYTLFEMLVPNSFKLYAPDRRDLVLVLDPAAAALPWELLHDRYERGSRPLAVASGMVRQLLDSQGRPDVIRAFGKTALVIGDPVVNDARFPALSGAAAEAAAVADVLHAQNYDVTALIGAAATPQAVLTAIHEKPWRIVHLAAHGVFNFVPAKGEAAVSGLVLGDRTFFTAADADQIRHVPDIVFINCCHLGQTAGEAQPFTKFHELAANLAVQFIRMGARAVVAAGWAVDDAAARTFAEIFYQEMFAGAPFGKAVGRARTRVFEQHGSQNTWGAYQCYGDPGFSLLKASASSRLEPPVSELEVVIAAEDIARRARTEDRAALLIELEALARSLPQAWLASPALRAALGAAYGELDQFESAVQHYEMLRTARNADAPISALEQLANLRVRWALRTATDDPGARPAALEQM